VVASVGVPVLFLGGPRRERDGALSEVADSVEGGAAGMAIGRAVYQDPFPAEMARLVADLFDGAPPDDVRARAAALT
jgi:2-amino-4,5-dihydroxy-6-oxo-7-(phosphonooxy)heptanoate synthase